MSGCALIYFIIKYKNDWVLTKLAKIGSIVFSFVQICQICYCPTLSFTSLCHLGVHTQTTALKKCCIYTHQHARPTAF